MTSEEMRQATGRGPEWRMIWMGYSHFPDIHHLCPSASSATPHLRERVRLAYARTASPGLELAACEECRIGWVQRIDVE